MNAPEDDPIVARLKAAADAMTDAPVRWDRVASLARRRVLVASVLLALVLAAATMLLTYGSSVGALKITGASPVSLPGVTASVPDVRGMRPGQPTKGGATTPAHPAGRPGGPVKMVLSISSPLLEADGKSTTTIEAVVLDARGDRLTNQHVTFTSMPGGQPVVTSPDGPVTIATVTSTTRAGLVTIQAHDGGLVASARFEQIAVKRVDSTCPESGGSTRAGEAVTTSEGIKPGEANATTGQCTTTAPPPPPKTVPTTPTSSTSTTTTTGTTTTGGTTSTNRTAGE